MAAEDDDFTFCQVGPPVEDYDAQKVADDISEIHVDDRNANAANTSSNSIVGSIWNGLFSRKQETVGSLSVNVIDASSRKEVDQQPKAAGQEAGRQPKPAEREVDQRPKKAEQEVAGGIWNSLFPHKQETVGSLSFNVINASSGKEVYQQLKPAEQDVGRRPKPAEQEVDQQSKKAEQEAAGSSNKATPEIKAPVRKPKPRAKVPYEKGYSQMDWLKLTRTHPDLADLKGQTNKRLIKMSEVKQHQSEDSMWTVLKGRVYNITPYMKFHPGGVDKLMKAVGKDCTFLFNKYHAWVNADFMLEKCLVGILDESK